MSTEKTFKINDQKVIHETLDGETIIINLENGNYFSMNATGAIVWNLLEKQSSVQTIVQALTNRFEIDDVSVLSTVTDLVTFLLNENLILEAETSIDSEPQEIIEQREVYLIPLIEKYEDMQEMLLADPIHDVEAMGWPKLK